MTVTLEIADGLSLGTDYVTKTCAILAQRRKGKSYTAAVFGEELITAGLPFVILDPTGAHWGLRASGDGQGPGLPVVILGGQHADLPLERGSGRFVADLVVEHPSWYVLDLSLFDSKGAEREFAADFAERLYRRKAQPGCDFPLHLFVDEADMFVPQDRDTGDARMLGAFQSIVRRGGLRGLGTTLISQRAALVNKSVLEQLDMLILLRTVGPNDRKAVESYIKAHGTDEQRKELLASLASLELGEAWIWEPGAEPSLFERVRIRGRRTFNSSATPKPGERRVEPRSFADVDLAALKEQMAETIEKAKATDPRELQKRIADLERELREVRTAPAEVEVVEVEVVPAWVEAAVAEIETYLRNTVLVAADELATQLHTIREALIPDVPRRGNAAGARALTDRPRPERTAQPDLPPPPTPRDEVTPGAPHAALPEGEAKVLAVAAMYPDGVTREQLTILTGYKKSTRDAYIRRLGARGFVGVDGRLVIATQAGFDALGDFEPLPTGEALRSYWLDRLPEGEARILGKLIEVYPLGMTRDALSTVTGYKKSTRDAYIRRLVARLLIRLDNGEPKAADTLYD